VAAFRLRGFADGDSVSVATEVSIDLLGAAEGAFGVNDPRGAVQGISAASCSAALVLGSESELTSF